MGFSPDYARRIGLQFYNAEAYDEMDVAGMKKDLARVERMFSGVKYRNRDMREFVTFLSDAGSVDAGDSSNERIALRMGQLIGGTYDFVSVLEAGLDLLDLLKVTSGPVHDGIVRALLPDDE